MSSNSQLFSIEEIIKRNTRSKVTTVKAESGNQEYNASQILVKPEYSIADMGKYSQIPFVTFDNALSLQSITPSGADEIQQSTKAYGSDTGLVPIDPIDGFISTLDTACIAHEGDGVAFSRKYIWRPDQSEIMYKTILNLAAALNCSAFTSGTLTIDSVNIIIEQAIGNGSLKTILNHTTTPDSDFTPLVATGLLIFLIHEELHEPFKLVSNLPVIITVTVNTTIDGTNTFQVGLLPFFPFQPNSSSFPTLWTPSMLGLWSHGSLDSAQEVFRDQDIDQRIDYSGLDRLGYERSGAPFR